MSPGVNYTCGEQRRKANLVGYANAVSCGLSGGRPRTPAELARNSPAALHVESRRDQDTLGRVHVLRCAAAANEWRMPYIRTVRSGQQPPNMS